VFGTTWHGCLEGDAFRGAWLRLAADLAGRDGIETGAVSFAAARERRIDILADAIEEHLDLDRILHLVEHGPTPGLPVVRGGLA
jgi:adenosylcobyric acid synthase